MKIVVPGLPLTEITETNPTKQATGERGDELSGVEALASPTPTSQTEERFSDYDINKRITDPIDLLADPSQL